MVLSQWIMSGDAMHPYVNPDMLPSSFMAVDSSCVVTFVTLGVAMLPSSFMAVDSSCVATFVTLGVAVSG